MLKYVLLYLAGFAAVVFLYERHRQVPMPGWQKHCEAWAAILGFAAVNCLMGLPAMDAAPKFTIHAVPPGADGAFRAEHPDAVPYDAFLSRARADRSWREHLEDLEELAEEVEDEEGTPGCTLFVCDVKQPG